MESESKMHSPFHHSFLFPLVFQGEPYWNAVLMRPPVTWSTSEVACWAGMPVERHGAGMDWLGDVVERNCIGEVISAK
jgi:hypothetical protein